EGGPLLGNPAPPLFRRPGEGGALMETAESAPAIERRLSSCVPFLFLAVEDAAHLLQKGKTARVREGQCLLRKGERPRELIIPVEGALREVTDDGGPGENLRLLEPLALYCLLRGE